MKIAKTCEQCGKEYNLRPDRIRLRDGSEYYRPLTLRSRFCSADCCGRHLGLTTHHNKGLHIHRDRKLHTERPEQLRVGPPYKKTCVVCLKQFEERRIQGRKTCSAACFSTLQKERYLSQRVWLICKQCGKPYSRIPAQAKRSNFCSRECNGRYRGLRIPVEKRMGNKKPLLLKSCIVCGEIFEAQRVQRKRKTCSQKCKNIASSQHNHVDKVSVTCRQCGKVKEVLPGHVGRSRFCSSRCAALFGANLNRDKPRTSIITECAFCGKQIKKFKSRLTYKKHFCSNECRMQSDVFSSPSGIEEIVAEWLSKNGVSFERQVPIWRFTIDFRIGDCLVEVNGDYWHALPGKYVLLTPQQHRRVHRDKMLNTYCRNRGIELLTIWEYEIKANDFSKLEPLKDSAPR